MSVLEEISTVKNKQSRDEFLSRTIKSLDKPDLLVVGADIEKGVKSIRGKYEKANAHTVAAFLYWFGGDTEKAIAANNRALKLIHNAKLTFTKGRLTHLLRLALSKGLPADEFKEVLDL